jgi:hypothetical protein
MLRGHYSCAISLLPTISSHAHLRVPGVATGTTKAARGSATSHQTRVRNHVFLTPIIPALTVHSPATPIIPALTRTPGGGGCPPPERSRRTDLSQFCPRSISRLFLHLQPCTISVPNRLRSIPFCIYQFRAVPKKQGEGHPFLFARPSGVPFRESIASILTSLLPCLIASLPPTRDKIPTP